MKAMMWARVKTAALAYCCAAVIGGGVLALMAPRLAGVSAAPPAGKGKPLIVRRGIVLCPSDVWGLEEKWIEWLKEAELNVLGLHGGAGVEDVMGFVNSERGRKFLSSVRETGIDIEYELHAVGRHLLPRSEFGKHPEWFRMDEDGKRVPDKNFCPSNPEALAVVVSNARELAKVLAPTTNRYYFWGDDVGKWCKCEKCGEMSSPDQELMVMNAILGGLRKDNPKTLVAYLAYDGSTGMEPPRKVRPAEGIFLEFAPYYNPLYMPLQLQKGRVKYVEKLDRLIQYFGAENAHVLGYWLDCSLFGRDRWLFLRTDQVKVPKGLPFYKDVVRADAEFYAWKGLRSITTFGACLDKGYFARHGAPPVAEYGAALRSVERINAERIRSLSERDFLPRIEVSVVVPTSKEKGIVWRYTLKKPADDWFKPGFDDSGWERGEGGFGKKGTPGAAVRTVWETEDIWLRREFAFPEGSFRNLHFLVHHDDNGEVFINGIPAARLDGWQMGYVGVEIAPDAHASLRPGKNILAVYCHQTRGGQYIDVGIAEHIDGATPP